MIKNTKFLICIVLLLNAGLTFAQDSAKTKNLDAVIVTGQYQPQSLKNSVYQIRVINSERIRLSGATNVQQVLNTQLGFRFSNDNSLGISDVQINGMSGRNIKILLDGAPVLDRFDQRVSLSQIDVNTIERIEIADGPMSVSFGSDAMAGVINIITKKNKVNGFSLTAKVQEETAANEYHPFSYRGLHSRSINIGNKINNWDLSAGGSHIEFNGFGGDKYGRGNTWLPKDQWLGNARLGYAKLGFNIYYRIDGMKEKIDDRNSINVDLDAALAKSIDQQFSTERFMHQLQSNYRINEKIELASMAAYTDLKRTTATDYRDFIANTSIPGTQSGQQDVSKLKSFSFRNTAQYKMNDKISLQPGFDFNYEKASGERITGTPSINDYAFFVSAEYKPNDKINIRPGFRVVKNSKYSAPPLIPSLNTKFILSKNLDLRIAYGYGFRAPALRELYFTFVDVNHNIIGNPNLKAETSNSFNGSLTWTKSDSKTANIAMTLGSFYNIFEKQIVLVPSISVPAQYTYYNIDRTKTAGFSLENKITSKHIEAGAGFNYIGYNQQYDAAIFKDNDRNFLWTPEINSNIIYKFSKLKTSLGLFYKYVGKKQDFSYQTIGTQSGLFLTETGSYSLADFTVTTAVRKCITLSGGIKNILDETSVISNTIVSSNVQHNSGGALSLSYGRSYFLGLTIHLTKNK